MLYRCSIRFVIAKTWKYDKYTTRWPIVTNQTCLKRTKIVTRRRDYLRIKTAKSYPSKKTKFDTFWTQRGSARWRLLLQLLNAINNIEFLVYTSNIPTVSVRKWESTGYFFEKKSTTDSNKTNPRTNTLCPCRETFVPICIRPSAEYILSSPLRESTRRNKRNPHDLYPPGKSLSFPAVIRPIILFLVSVVSPVRTYGLAWHSRAFGRFTSVVMKSFTTCRSESSIRSPLGSSPTADNRRTSCPSRPSASATFLPTPPLTRLIWPANIPPSNWKTENTTVFYTLEFDISSGGEQQKILCVSHKSTVHVGSDAYDTTYAGKVSSVWHDRNE